MNAPFAWPGGKRNLIKQVLPRIPKHTIYVEVFCGSAKLLFAKPPSVSEVINDLNGDLINFFRIAKHRPAELAELIEHDLLHPERFRELRTSVALDEVHRALHFVYCTWHSYGAKGEHFAAAQLQDLLRGGKRRPLDLVRLLLEKTSSRLRGVRIEQRDFASMLGRFDSPETFFYLDPPYVHFGENGRYNALTNARREELFSILARVRGTFLMSFDNCSEVRFLAAEHDMIVHEAKTRYALGNTLESRRIITELFVEKGKV